VFPQQTPKQLDYKPLREPKEYEANTTPTL